MNTKLKTLIIKFILEDFDYIEWKIGTDMTSQKSVLILDGGKPTNGMIKTTARFFLIEKVILESLLPENGPPPFGEVIKHSYTDKDYRKEIIEYFEELKQKIKLDYGNDREILEELKIEYVKGMIEQ